MAVLVPIMLSSFEGHDVLGILVVETYGPAAMPFLLVCTCQWKGGGGAILIVYRSKALGG